MPETCGRLEYLQYQLAPGSRTIELVLGVQGCDEDGDVFDTTTHSCGQEWAQAMCWKGSWQSKVRGKRH